MNCIKVWAWEDAPEELKNLSCYSGKETWVALVPLSMRDDYIPWLNPRTSFGYRGVSRKETSKGVVFIGTN
jgi:hypothetical protein